jgi:hypothetical protein
MCHSQVISNSEKLPLGAIHVVLIAAKLVILIEINKTADWFAPTSKMLEAWFQAQHL